MDTMLSAQQEGRVTVVALQGDYGSFDAASLGALCDRLLELADGSQPPVLLLDLHSTEYFGSSFLGILVRCHAHLRRRGGVLLVCRPHVLLRQEMRSMRLDEVWRVFDSRDEALHEAQHEAERLSAGK
jgi:anti-sigma B factor antagonist